MADTSVGSGLQPPRGSTGGAGYGPTALPAGQPGQGATLAGLVRVGAEQTDLGLHPVRIFPAQPDAAAGWPPPRDPGGRHSSQHGIGGIREAEHDALAGELGDRPGEQ